VSGMKGTVFGGLFSPEGQQNSLKDLTNGSVNDIANGSTNGSNSFNNGFVSFTGARRKPGPRPPMPSSRCVSSPLSKVYKICTTTTWY